MLKLKRSQSLPGMDVYEIYRNGEMVVSCNCTSNCTDDELKKHWFPQSKPENWEESE